MQLLHQKDPWKFIEDDLILKVKKHLILRPRTRNKAEKTILDLNKSCQLVPGEEVGSLDSFKL